MNTLDIYNPFSKNASGTFIALMDTPTPPINKRKKKSMTPKFTAFIEEPEDLDEDIDDGDIDDDLVSDILLETEVDPEEEYLADVAVSKGVVSKSYKASKDGIAILNLVYGTGLSGVTNLEDANSVDEGVRLGILGLFHVDQYAYDFNPCCFGGSIDASSRTLKNGPIKGTEADKNCVMSMILTELAKGVDVTNLTLNRTHEKLESYSFKKGDAIYTLVTKNEFVVYRRFEEHNLPCLVIEMKKKIRYTDLAQLMSSMYTIYMRYAVDTRYGADVMFGVLSDLVKTRVVVCVVVNGGLKFYLINGICNSIVQGDQLDYKKLSFVMLHILAYINTKVNIVGDIISDEEIDCDKVVSDDLGKYAKLYAREKKRAEREKKRADDLERQLNALRGN